MQAGKKIKVIRALKGLSQDNLAAKINKTRGLISHIEQTGKVSPYTLSLILKVFDMSAEEFERFDIKDTLRAYKQPEKDEVNMLRERLEHYQKENKALKEVIQSQKKLIRVLEKKKR